LTYLVFIEDFALNPSGCDIGNCVADALIFSFILWCFISYDLSPFFGNKDYRNLNAFIEESTQLGICGSMRLSFLMTRYSEGLNFWI